MRHGEKRPFVAMTKKQKAALLRKVNLFSGVGPRALDAIAGLMTEIEFAPQRYIVRQGQVGTGFYLIASGRAQVTRGNAAIAELRPGDFFGELSVLDQSPRMAHVIAVEPTTCLALASWDLARLLEKNPKVTLAMLRVVAARLRAATEQHTH